MANLPADLPTNWTQGQIISPNGTEVGLTEQHGYNYLNEQVNAAQEEVNTLSQEVDALSQEVSGAASQASVDNIAERIGETGDTGGSSTEGTLMGKVNALVSNSDSTSENVQQIITLMGQGVTANCVKSIQRGTTSAASVTISTVDPEKCLVILKDSVNSASIEYGHGTQSYVANGSLFSELASTKLTISRNSYKYYDTSLSSQKTRYGSVFWQIIEFY